jgi:hypothetical protein
MDEQQELRLRRQAIRLHVKDVRLKVILEKVQRSRAWFNKWQKRFDQLGAAGLRSRVVLITRRGFARRASSG